MYMCALLRGRTVSMGSISFSFQPILVYSSECCALSIPLLRFSFSLSFFFFLSLSVFSFPSALFVPPSFFHPSSPRYRTLSFAPYCHASVLLPAIRNAVVALPYLRDVSYAAPPTRVVSLACPLACLLACLRATRAKERGRVCSPDAFLGELSPFKHSVLLARHRRRRITGPGTNTSADDP